MDPGLANPQDAGGAGGASSAALASRLMGDEVLNPADLVILTKLQDDLEGLTKLRNVVASGDVTQVKKMLGTMSICIDVPCYDDFHDSFTTLLGFVASRPQLRNGTTMLELLLEHGASVNALSDCGQTALLLACANKNVAAARLLLSRGARHDIVDHYGWSPLCAAVSLSSAKNPGSGGATHGEQMFSVILVELLLWYHADKNGTFEDRAAVKVANNGSRTTSNSLGISKIPMVIAIEHDNYLGLQALLLAGASPARGPTLLTALKLPSASNEVMLSALCSAGADPFVRDEDGKLPVQVASTVFGPQDDRTLLLNDYMRTWENLFGMEPSDWKTELAEMLEKEKQEQQALALENAALGGGGGFGSSGSATDLEAGLSISSPGAAAKLSGTSSGATTTPQNRGPTMSSSSPSKHSKGTTSGFSNLISSPISVIATVSPFNRNNAAGSGKQSAVLLQREPQVLQELRNLVRSWEKPSREMQKDPTFQMVMLLTLLIALYFPDLWVVGDVANTTALDVLLGFVIGAFLFEISVQCLGTVGYTYSFFFWMDSLGMLSVVADFSFVAEATYSQSEDGDATIILVTRMFKLAARAGRFFRLVKILKMLPGMRQTSEYAGTARKISDRLHAAVSIRVSFVIIFMVILIPGLLIVTVRLAEQDLSLLVWPDLVAQTQLTDTLSKSAEMARFFSKEEFYPYELERRFYWGTTEPVWESKPYYREMVVYPGTDNISGPGATHYLETFGRDGSSEPNDRNIVVRKSDPILFTSSEWNTLHPTLEATDKLGPAPLGNSTHAYSIAKVRYNFTYTHQLDSGMNMVLIALIMTLLVVFSMALQGVIQKVVLLPLESLLNQVRDLAATMFKSVSDMSSAIKRDDDEDDDLEDEIDDEEDEMEFDGSLMETALLAKIASKLTLLTDITMAKQMKDQLDDEIQQYTATAVYKQKTNKTEEEEEIRDEEFLRLQRVALMQAGLTLEDVESFEFNPLELDDFQTYAAVLWFLQGDAMNLGGFIKDTLKIDERRIQRFLEEISGRYVNTNPYHNWLHAVDVAHGVYSFLNLCKTRDIFSKSDRFAMLLSAVCHDAGHPGYNNPFLVESNDPLALKYNDKSPLENMHCSIMFEAGFVNPETAVFANCSKAHYMEIRRVSIDAILHTDMINHFPMVSHIKLLHEENSEIIQLVQHEYWQLQSHSYQSGAALSLGQQSQWELPAEAVEFWKQPEKAALLRNLILHSADISNPMKPFPICRAWAYLVLEEFFLQGDLEKSRGLTVQMLNDREKVKKPQSQMGFIEFVVAPLYFQFAIIMPSTYTCAETIVSNVRQWEAEWLEEQEPTEEEQQGVHNRILNLETALANTRQLPP
ncbi:unnamed protein product [Amoebophrya sp. A120]|nr:unnamed protein product [Amoebophrya sp. A120]|eukprot:GSA120T00001527001.1